MQLQLFMCEVEQDNINKPGKTLEALFVLVKANSVKPRKCLK